MGTTMKLLCLLAVAAHSSALLTSPPRIVKQPTMEEQLFMVAQPGEADKPFIIECEAEGEPAPQYRWVKNGKPFEYASYADRMSQQPGRGSLVVSKPKDEDMGQYQCFAYNEWGTATSNSVFVRKAELNSFKDTGDGAQKLLTAQEGRPFKLTCHPPDGWPKPNVYWMLQGDQGQLKTINNSRMTLDPEGNLWFSNVTRYDASEDTNLAYTCAAKSLFRNEYKLGNKVFLKVKQTGGISPTQNKYPPEEQYTTRRNEVALRGKKAELYCIYGGTPLPQIVWKKDGQHIMSSSRVTQDNYGKTLVINPVTNGDKGTYTCEVSNGVGSAQSHSINLNIKAAPYFTVAPESLNLAENEEAVIRCKADGSPEPQIKWVYNGEPIERAPYNARRTVAADSITITGLMKTDTGNYGCNATNSIGYVYKDIYINVQSIPPEITERPENVTKVDGSEVVMRCRVFGAPRPIVKWMRNDVELTGGNFNITTEGDLVIRRVGYGDAGLYRCYAQNRLGENSAYGSLDVKQRSTIKNEPEDYEVAAGSQATFRCTPDTDPDLTAEITWEFKGQTIDFEAQPRFKMTNDYTLLISDTTELDSGSYQCVVKTPIDEARAEATLIVQDRPNPPLLVGIECREKVANLHWEPKGDNRAPILRYAIQYNTTFTPDTWDSANDNVPAIETSWTVELSPWANYTFRVVAHNKIGPSAPSGHSEVCTTQPDVPYKNPDKVEGRGRAPNNMLIFWSKMPQIEHNGPGFYYQVSFKRNDTGEGWTDQTVQDWRQSELLVPNTPTFVPYKIKVVAWNSKGASNVAPVEVIGWSGEDKPLLAPTNFTLVEVISGNEALLSWNPVPPESVRGHFNGYRIQTWTDGEEDQVREVKAKSDATKVMINILKPHKKNNVRIMVYNGFDNGPPSDTLSFVTPEGKPGPVRSFNAYPIGSSAMLLTWDKPMEENGVLTGYKVYYAKTVGTQVEPWVERKNIIDSKFDRAKLAGLQSDTKYRIELRAMTKAGEGKGFYVEQATRADTVAVPDVPAFDAYVVPPPPPPDGQPAKPKSPAVHVLVRWQPALDGHPGTQFQASYRLKDHPQWEQWPMEMDDDYVIIMGLEPNRVYQVKVTAWDGNYHTDSEIKEVDTTNDGPLIMPDNNKMAQAGWFIGVMLALAFLLLVLVLVCVARRNRGGKYDVHDRELAAGRRDHPDTGFHEYTHPLDNKSRHSMSSGNKPGPESDTDSMAEYGEGETGRFTEDGSFIGQYVPGARVLPPAPLSPPAPAPAPAPAAARGPQPPTYV